MCNCNVYAHSIAVSKRSNQVKSKEQPWIGNVEIEGIGAHSEDNESAVEAVVMESEKTKEHKTKEHKTKEHKTKEHKTKEHKTKEHKHELNSVAKLYSSDEDDGGDTMETEE